jgi:phage-related minor tail protein
MKGKKIFGGKKIIATYLHPKEAAQLDQVVAAHGVSRARFLELLIMQVLKKLTGSTSVIINNGENPTKRLKTRTVSTRLTEGESQRLAHAAAKHGMLLSPYVSYILRGILSRTVTLSHDEIHNFRKVRAELGKIGSNLNQAVKLLKANPYGQNIVTTQLIIDLQAVVDAERDNMSVILRNNLESWANLYGQNVSIHSQLNSPKEKEGVTGKVCAASPGVKRQFP